jgi:hypothetical protein
MQKCLDAHSGLLVTTSTLNTKQYIILKDDHVSVRVDLMLLKEIESNAKLNPSKIGSTALDQLIHSFESVHPSIDSHGPTFVRWVSERISALQEVSAVLCGYGFAEQSRFCNELNRIQSQCESALQLAGRFPSILATCREVKLPPRLYSLVHSKHESSMSLFKFLTLSLKNQDAVKYLDDRVSRLIDASSKNLKEALDTRAQYDFELRQCEEARSRLKDCLARSQKIASFVIFDKQCIADSKIELEQACHLTTALLLNVRAAQNLMVKARKKGVIYQFDTLGSVFMKWKTDLETFDHAPRCLDAFLMEVRQRRAYHGCLAAFEEMIHSRLEIAKAKETARRAEFQTRFAAHMPSEFREMLIDPVPALEKRLHRCGSVFVAFYSQTDSYRVFYLLLQIFTRGHLTVAIRIPQLDELESLPINAFLRENSLDFCSSSSSFTSSEAQTLLSLTQDVSTCTELRNCCDVGTDTAHLDEDNAALTALAALDKARMEEQQNLLRSQFDAEVSGYQVQLTEVERAKDTQLCVQANVILAMLEMLHLPDNFPEFPDCSSESSDSSNRSKFQEFLSAFQAYTELQHQEREALQLGVRDLQRQLDESKRQLQLLSSGLDHGEQHVSQSSRFLPVMHPLMYADACDNLSEEGSPFVDFQSLRAREAEHLQLVSEMEERLRSALLAEEAAKRERDNAIKEVALSQQQLHLMMQELQLQHERQLSPHASFSSAAAAASFSVQPDKRAQPPTVEPLSPKQMYLFAPLAAADMCFVADCPSSPRRRETDSLLAKLLEMGYETQAAAVRLPLSCCITLSYCLTWLQATIAAMSMQGDVPTLDAVVEKLLNP